MLIRQVTNRKVNFSFAWPAVYVSFQFIQLVSFTSPTDQVLHVGMPSEEKLNDLFSHQSLRNSRVTFINLYGSYSWKSLECQQETRLQRVSPTFFNIVHLIKEWQWSISHQRFILKYCKTSKIKTWNDSLKIVSEIIATDTFNNIYW